MSIENSNPSGPDSAYTWNTRVALNFTERIYVRAGQDYVDCARNIVCYLQLPLARHLQLFALLF